MPGVRGAHFISFIVQGSASVRKRAVEWQYQFDEPACAYRRGHRLSCSVYRSGSALAVLQWYQLTAMDGEAASLRAENKKRARPRFVRLRGPEQRLDQAGGNFRRANEGDLGKKGRCPLTLPLELDGNRLNLFRDPGAVNATEGQRVIATGSNRADFVFFVRELDCLENGSIGVGNGHKLHCAPQGQVQTSPGRSIP